jgi:hypothetical protein
VLKDRCPSTPGFCHTDGIHPHLEIRPGGSG